ncbi:MAG: (Fe-S)-binding protein [Candidatus Baltobacteraceae bacterium]
MSAFVASLERNITDEDVVNLEACIDCKHCGDACAWYLASDDETLHPTYKTNFVRQIYKRFLTLEGKVAGSLGLTATPTVEDLRDHMSSFWSCTACGRCTLACPAGLSTRRIVRLARAAYSDSELSLENPTLRAITENTDRHLHSFGLTPEQVLGRIGLFLCSEGIEIPIEVSGADLLFVCPAAGNTRMPDYGIKMIQILNAAGVSYSVSSSLMDTGTEIDHIVVHHELSKRILEAWEDEAERLGCKAILAVECGCDTRTLFGDATETLGRPLKVPVISADAIMLEAIESGALPVDPVDDSITLHDPCHSTRLAGMGDLTRALLSRVTNNFIEMTPNREHNYCCNGGAGGLRLPENTEKRRKASVFKANQILGTGADYVATPCVVCALTLEDVCKTYELTSQERRMSYMLFEIVHQAMMRAVERRGERERVRFPAELLGRDELFVREHSLSGWVARASQRDEFPSVLAWLEKDDIVKRYAKTNPLALLQLDHFKKKIGQADPVCESVSAGGASA